jgi:hypothetical protein
MDKFTLGASRARLIELGYRPVSVYAPDVKLPHLVAEHPVGLSPEPGERSVAAFVVTAAALEHRDAVAEVLKKHGIAKAPVRTASDGALWYLLRGSQYVADSTRRLESNDEVWFALESVIPGNNFESASREVTVIPVAGDWSNGSPLNTPRAKLPAIESPAALFADLQELIYRVQPVTEWVNPKPGARDENSPYVVYDRDSQYKYVGADGLTPGERAKFGGAVAPAADAAEDSTQNGSRYHYRLGIPVAVKGTDFAKSLGLE